WLGAACAAARGPAADHRLLPRGHRRVLMAATFDVRAARGLPANVARAVARGVVLMALGVAVALPDQSQDALLGAVGAGAAILALLQPRVAVLLLLAAVPFGTRASTTDTSTDPSIGVAELLVALLTLAWLARGVRRREVNLQTGGLVVAILGVVALAGLSIG